MTAPAEGGVPDNLERLRADHVEVAGSCSTCVDLSGAPRGWPCDVAEVLAALAASREEARRLGRSKVALVEKVKGLEDRLALTAQENDRLRHGPLHDDERSRCTAGQVRAVYDEAEEAGAEAERLRHTIASSADALARGNSREQIVAALRAALRFPESPTNIRDED